MARQWLLLIDGQGLTACRRRHGAIFAEARFAPDAAGLAAFESHVRNHPGETWRVLANVGEEAFEHELVPPLRGGERRRFIEGRLARRFPGCSRHCAVSLGRRPDGRRDERLLLVALTHGQDSEPWIDILRASAARVSHVLSLPLLSDALLRHIPGLLHAPLPSRFLLLTLHARGLRQSWFDRNELIFSRLSACPGPAPEDVAACARRECERVRRYLADHRHVESGATIRVLLLAHTQVAPALRRHLEETDGIRIDVVDLGALAACAGMKNLPADFCADHLFLHLLADAGKTAQMADAGLLRPYRLGYWRAALHGACAVFLCAGAVVAVSQLMVRSAIEARAASAQGLAEADAARHAAILRDHPPPLPLAALRALTARHDALLREMDDPSRLLALAGHVLERTQSPVDLESLLWRAGSGGVPAQMELTAALRMPPQTPQTRIVAEAQALARAMGAGSGLDVGVLRMPFDLSPDRPFSSAEIAGHQAEPARFVLRMTGRIGP